MCHNELNLDVLCVKCLKAECGKIQQIMANDICVAEKLQAAQLWADKGYFNSLCAKNANFENACISNLKANNFIPTTKYRATVNYSVNTMYTLGSFLNFDNIVDDPNTNVSLIPNTSYTAPVSGYYTMSFKVNIDQLVSSNGPILGIPVANPEIYVNGLLVREAFSPFLSFFNTQKVLVDSLITLQAGDVVTMKYNVLAGSGAQVLGTVNIIGQGIEDGNSLFKIILLSALNAGQNPTCPPCPEVVIPCRPITPPPANPCDGCQ